MSDVPPAEVAAGVLAPGLVADRPASGVLRRYLGFAVKAAVSVALLGWLLHRVHVSSILLHLRALSPATLLVAVAANALAQLLVVYRWHRILRVQRLTVPYADAVRFYFVGAFFNNFLPSSMGGDLVKGYMIFRETERPQLAFMTTLADRYLGLGAILVFGTAAAAAVPASIYGRPLWVWLGLSLAAFLLGSALLVSPIAAWAARWVRGRSRGTYLALNTAIKCVELIVREWRMSLAGLSCTALFYVVVVATHLWLARDLGVPIGWVPATTYTLVIAVGAMFPLSINGIGVREYLYTVLFGLSAWEPDVAIGMSWAIFGIVLAVSLIGLPCYLASRR